MAKPARLLLIAALVGGATPARAQRVPSPGDTRNGMLLQAWQGLLPAPAAVSEPDARHRCLDLPADPPNDRFQGPHGDSLISASCEVLEYRTLDSITTARWTVARYGWRSIFTAEDASRGPGARDTLTEEESVLLDYPRPGQLRAVWHARYENDFGGVWRSITPALAALAQGTLLSVQSCVNGTGGCSQEFLLRRPDGRWIPVWQVWVGQLPPGFADRMEHGFRIDPRTLRGEAGFYGASDPNCCPSQRLLVKLRLQGDSLVLGGHTVAPAP